MTYRSTALNYALRYCPRALDYWSANVPHDKGMFQQGIAAHSVLQEFGNRARHGTLTDPSATAASVVRHLTTTGHNFDGHQEPPMHPEDALAGAKIAVDYNETHPVNESADVEIGLAVDGGWKPVAYDDPKAHWKAILDRRYALVQDDDEDSGECLSGMVASDYKTAFSANVDECDTIQMKGQGLVLLAHHPDADFILREVVNLRTGASYRMSTLTDKAGLAEMATWRGQIEMAIRYSEVRDADGARVANPGASCMGCPFVTSCKPAQAYMATVGLGDNATHEMIVTAYAIAAARADALKGLATKILDHGSMNVNGGMVGYKTVEERVAREGAHLTILQSWLRMDDDAFRAWRSDNGDVVKMIEVMEPGAGVVGRLAKVLYPYTKDTKLTYKTNRDEFEDGCLTTETTSKFGIYKEKAAVNGDGGAA